MHWLSCLLCCVLWAPAYGAADQASSTDYDVEILKEAHVATDGPGLLDFFRKRTVSEADREPIQSLIRQLGDATFQHRQEAAANLVARGPVVVKMLQDSLQNEDPEIVRRAQECLRLLQRSSEPVVLAAAARVLAIRKPAGAAEVLLAYLPSATDETVNDEVRAALSAVALQDGRPEKVLLDAVAAPLPVRRGAAAEALIRGGLPEGRSALGKLLRDPDAGVRLWVALALADRKETQSVATLIDLLVELPREQAWRVEDVLRRIAGEKAPEIALGSTEEERRACRETWSRWWSDNQTTIDLARVDLSNRQLGYTVMVEVDLRGALNGKVREVGLDGKTRWQIEGLQYALDAQIIGPGRVLITEYTGRRVSERNFKGEVLWKKEFAATVYPMSAQRLPNGNTFVACRNMLLELDRAGTEVSRIDRGNMDVMSAQKLRNGEIIVMTNQGGLLRLNAAGKELKSLAVASAQVFGGGFEVLPNGRVLVPQYQQGKVVEYDPDGKILWEANVPTPSFASRLANGHTLVVSTGTQQILELDQSGKEVWQYKDADGGRLLRARRR